MNKQAKTTGLVAAVAALVLIGMFFVPAVAADPQYIDDVHYNGVPSYTLGGNITVSFIYDSMTLLVEPSNKNTPYEVNFTTGAKVNASPFNVSNDKIKIIEVNSMVNLSTADGVMSEFQSVSEKPSFNYLGKQIHPRLFGTASIFQVIPGESRIYVNNITGSTVEGEKNYTTGSAFTVDTNWGFTDSKVKIAVKPAPGYGVYDWYVNKDSASGEAITDYSGIIEKSKDPNDGATTYNVTIKNYNVYVEPKLRDSGSVIVSYVFLDADTYVMEIPADFAIKKIGEAVNNKTINMTTCDLQEGHKLNVTMDSESGYDDGTLLGSFGPGFMLKNVATPSALAGYTIGTKKNYNKESIYTLVTKDEAVVLDTDGMSNEKIKGNIVNGTLSTDLEFNLKGMTNTNALGKYKDKLTFVVAITQ